MVIMILLRQDDAKVHAVLAKIHAVDQTRTISWLPYSGKFSRGPVFAVDWQTMKIKPAK